MNIRTVICLAIISALSACSSIPYRIDIEQGNEVEAKDLARLKIGMSKSQVQRTIGTPLIQDIFHEDRWDYVNRYRNGRTNKVSKSNISLHFTNGLLNRVDKAGYHTIETAPTPYSVNK